MKIYINGEFFDASEAKVSVMDHGFLYGDGIFEGIRLYNKRLFKLDEHLERLEYSAKSILLDLNWTRQDICTAIRESCRVNQLTDAYVRLIVTRGEGSLGLSPKNCKHSKLIVIASQIQLYSDDLYSKGLKIITVPTRRINSAALPPMVKSLNYLNNILAKIEAVHLGYEEAIMLNDQGYVAECTGDNIFIVQKGRLFTPPPSTGTLSGITRKAVIDIADSLHVPLSETTLTRYDLWNAEECFLTGTAAEIIPVVEVDGRRVGSGYPGELTKKFSQAFKQIISSEGIPLG